MSVVRDGLLRSVPFQLARADESTEGDDGLTLEGHAAVFDQRTLIDSWEGQFYERIRRGAFRKSIRENTPVLQFDHGRHPLVGSIPIGAIQDLREDDEGLFTSARLSDNWLIQPVRDAIANRSIKGMSFRFGVVREEWRDKDGKVIKPDELNHLLWEPGDRGPLERELIELRVPELGPVVFPAYEGTSVSVRAREVVSLIGDDRELAREVRASLARETTPRPKAGIEDLGDPDVRRDVARALLFGTTKTSDAPTREGHPSAEPPSDDAPTREGHPSPGTDAPPPDGHPSNDPTYTKRLQGHIRAVTGLMADRLATIEEK